MFSVIIPTKSSDTFSLNRAVKSLSLQQIDEIIIVFDGPVDTLQVSDLKFEPKNKCLKFLSSGNCTQGPGVARQVGVDNAKGEYILFLDSDDEYKKGSIENLEKHICDNNRPDIIVMDCLLKAGENENYRVDLPFFQNNSKQALLKHMFELRTRSEVMLNCVKTEFLQNSGIAFRAGFHEDIDYTFLLFKNAKNWTVTSDATYIKHQHPHSITSFYSEKHLEGLLGAFENILQNVAKMNVIKSEMTDGIVNMVGSLISKTVANGDETIWDQLKTSLFKPGGIFSYVNETKLKSSSNEKATKYSRLFHEFVKNKEAPFFEIKENSKNIINQSLGCRDLKENLFLRPNELRTCCRRFFVEGEIRGDVVILSENDNKNLQNFYRKKNELAWRIATGAESECTGCPFITTDVDFNEPIKSTSYISMEEHTVCNMKCTYCDDTYYGGLTPAYDINELLKNLIEHQSNPKDNLKTIVWGGGEPTIGKQFEANIELFVSAAPDAEHRIVTNSVKYSPSLEKLLQEGNIQFTTSVDAGTPEVFSKIRGYNYRGLDRVLTNIARYSEAADSPITIKYLFSEENASFEEVIAYSNKITEYGLQNNIFQISINFKFEKISQDMMASILLLFGKLYENNCKFIFLDEIVLQRLHQLNNTQIEDIKEKISSFCNLDFIEQPYNLKQVSIYGASFNTIHLIDKSNFFNKTKINKIFDSDPKKHGKIISSKAVEPYNVEKDHNDNIYISAVQGFSSIYTHLMREGHSENLIVRKLII